MIYLVKTPRVDGTFAFADERDACRFADALLEAGGKAIVYDCPLHTDRKTIDRMLADELALLVYCRPTDERSEGQAAR